MPDVGFICATRGDEVKVISQEKKVAYSSYRCDECGRKIEAGETYELFVGKPSGEKSFIHRTCADCLSLLDHFFCESYICGKVIEQLEEYVHGVGGEIQSDRLAMLTPSAAGIVLELIDDYLEALSESTNVR